jgi:hypothetical protein
MQINTDKKSRIKLLAASASERVFVVMLRTTHFALRPFFLGIPVMRYSGHHFPIASAAALRYGFPHEHETI